MVLIRIIEQLSKYNKQDQITFALSTTEILLVKEPLQSKLREREPLTESRRIQELDKFQANPGEPLKERRPHELEEFLCEETSP
jgi:hypothetical protein